MWVIGILLFSLLLLCCGFAVVDFSSRENAIAQVTPLFAAEETEELVYQVSFLGRTAQADLQLLNRLEGLRQQYAALTPAPVRLLSQSCLWLRQNAPAVFQQLPLWWEALGGSASQLWGELCSFFTGT